MCTNQNKSGGIRLISDKVDIVAENLSRTKRTIHNSKKNNLLRIHNNPIHVQTQ